MGKKRDSARTPATGGPWGLPGVYGWDEDRVTSVTEGATGKLYFSIPTRAATLRIAPTA
jgi:hypothetical protein